MSSVTTFAIVSKSYDATLAIGRTLGRRLRGGEVIELIGDLGSGKTALVRGLAEGINSADQVQSPSFTISRIYRGRGSRPIELNHFDFHRLENPGVVAQALAEVISDPEAAIAVEWSQIVSRVLPKQRLQIQFEVETDETRTLKFVATGTKHQKLVGDLK